jgi:hypothetical protein
MTEIIVNDDMARQIADASPPIVFVDGKGRRLAHATPVGADYDLPPGLSQEEWVEIKRRFDNPGEYVTFQEIKDRLGW